jgi:hypothetical protein
MVGVLRMNFRTTFGSGNRSFLNSDTPTLLAFEIIRNTRSTDLVFKILAITSVETAEACPGSSTMTWFSQMKPSYFFTQPGEIVAATKRLL